MGPLVYVILIVSGLALYLIVNFFVNKYKHSVVLDEIKEIANIHGFKYIEEKNQKYDFILTNDVYEIFVKIAKIPRNSSVTINSKETWQLRWGGKRKGRNYPNSRYLNELQPFLKSNVTSKDKETIRLVLLYPTTEVVLKYLNESEIATVTPSSVSHGFKVLKYDEFNKEFDKLFILKEKRN